MIGSATQTKLENSHIDVIGTGRRCKSNPLYLDLTQSPHIWPSLPECQAMLICASMNNLVDCEKNPGLSKKINSEAVRQLVHRYKNITKTMIFISTVHVFDGTRIQPDSNCEVSPSCIYGLHKAEAEKIIISEGGLVIRLSKVIGNDFPRFKNWAQCLIAGKKIHCYTNLNTSLLPLKNVVDLIACCIKKQTRGIIHYSGKSNTSYYEIGCMLAQLLGVDESLVIGEQLLEHNKPVMPKDSSIKNSQIIDEYGILHVSSESVITDWLYQTGFLSRLDNHKNAKN